MDPELRKLLLSPHVKRYKCGPGHQVQKKSWSRRAHSRWGRNFRRLFVLGIWGMVAFSLLMFVLFIQMPPLKTALSTPRKASIVILDRNDTHIRTINDLYGLPVEVEDLPDHVWQAIIATEDKRFFSHMGIDPIGMLRAFLTNTFSGGIRQGGSTITQQVAKNIFLTRQKSVKRKLQELMVAFWLEAKFTKAQILSMYLNRVSLVSGKYGLNTAAKELFNKEAKELTIAEAAIISAMLKAPSRYHPYRDPAASEQRTRLILKNMYEQEYISGKEYATALDSLKVIKPQKTRGIRYFTDYIVREVRSRIGEIETDLVIKTTLDLSLHKKAQAELKKMLTTNTDKDVSQGAVLFMKTDGAILTMIGGRDYGESQFNRATDAKRQPGSSFKPFVYLAAFEKGFNPQTPMWDAPVRIGKWQPENFNGRYYGNVSIQQAFAKSMNSVPVRLAQQVGLRQVIDTAKRLGIVSPFRYDFSLVLGASELSLLELVSAYAPFANGGKGIGSYAIKEIKDEDDKVLYTRMTEAYPMVISPEHYNMLRLIFSSVIAQGTGTKAYFNGLRGGKTGTSQNSRDAWFIGFTDDTVGGVWMGNDNGTPMTKVYGGTLPAELFKNILQ